MYEKVTLDLSDRRMCRRILQVHKIENDQPPLILKKNFPHITNHSPNGNILKTFHEQRSRTNRYTNSFFPDAIASWNGFITHFGNMPSFVILKHIFHPSFVLKKTKYLRYTRYYRDYIPFSWIFSISNFINKVWSDCDVKWSI